MQADAPWVLLRGLTRESGHWSGAPVDPARGFAEQFKQAMAPAAVVCLDLPGNGVLHAQPSPTTIEAMVEPCRAQLRALGVAPPYRLLAMSMGAMVAVAWAHAHPGEVAASVLINASMRPFSTFAQRLRPHNYGRLLQLALLPASDVQWERAALAMTCNFAHPQVLGHWLALRRAHPVSRANALRQLWAASRFRAPTTASGVPTLVLTSAADQLVSSTCSAAMAEHWGWPLRIHPHAGHDLPQDDPGWVVAQVRHWSLGL